MSIEKCLKASEVLATTKFTLNNKRPIEVRDATNDECMLFDVKKAKKLGRRSSLNTRALSIIADDAKSIEELANSALASEDLGLIIKACEIIFKTFDEAGLCKRHDDIKQAYNTLSLNQSVLSQSHSNISSLDTKVKLSTNDYRLLIDDKNSEVLSLRRNVDNLKRKAGSMERELTSTCEPTGITDKITISTNDSNNNSVSSINMELNRVTSEINMVLKNVSKLESQLESVSSSLTSQNEESISSADKLASVKAQLNEKITNHPSARVAELYCEYLALKHELQHQVDICNSYDYKIGTAKMLIYALVERMLTHSQPETIQKRKLELIIIKHIIENGNELLLDELKEFLTNRLKQEDVSSSDIVMAIYHLVGVKILEIDYSFKKNVVRLAI